MRTHPGKVRAVAGDDRGAPRLDWTVTRDGEETLVAAEGEMDISSAEAFGAVAREHLAAGPVALDLRALSFMDSSGVRMLDALLRDAERTGNGLRVLPDLQPGVRQVLDLTGMLGVLRLT